MPFGYGGDIIGIISILLLIWGLIGVLRSGADTGTKILWVVILFLAPILGFLLWYFIGPGDKALPGRR